MKRTADREAVERRLHRAERESLAEWCRLRRIPLESWPCHPEALVWVDLAIGRAADEAMKDGRAESRAAALALVCPALGLDGDHVRRRWERKAARVKQLRAA